MIRKNRSFGVFFCGTGCNFQVFKGALARKLSGGKWEGQTDEFHELTTTVCSVAAEITNSRLYSIH